MDKETAEQVLQLAMSASHRADESVEIVARFCSAEERRAYGRCAGAIMASVFEGLMVPLYGEHPEMAPQWYKDMDEDMSRGSNGGPR